MPPRTTRSRALVLASGSPRRAALLRAAGFHPDVVPSRVEERALPGEDARSQVERLALAKAREVAGRIALAEPQGAPGAVVLGADTLVVVDEVALGKPRDPEHAVALLSRLVGRQHRVMTAVALLAGDDTERFCVESRVTMRPADVAEIRAYVASGEPLDKAGAYAAQGRGRRFIDRIEGSESNVIGLPMDETRAILARLGVFAADGDGA